MAKVGMSKETYDYICKYIDSLELDLENGVILNKKPVSLSTYGYPKVFLGRKPIFQHQVFAVARWGEKCIGMTVNHKNECKIDNSWNNLELLSHEDNVKAKSQLTGSCKPKQPIKAINLNTGEIYFFESVREAGRQLGLLNQYISKVLNGKRNRVGSFTFKRDIV